MPCLRPLSLHCLSDGEAGAACGLFDAVMVTVVVVVHVVPETSLPPIHAPYTILNDADSAYTCLFHRLRMLTIIPERLTLECVCTCGNVVKVPIYDTSIRYKVSNHSEHLTAKNSRSHLTAHNTLPPFGREGGIL